MRRCQLDTSNSKKVEGEAVCDVEMNLIVLQNAKIFSIKHVTTSIWVNFYSMISVWKANIFHTIKWFVKFDKH